MPPTAPPQVAEFAVNSQRQKGSYRAVISGELDLATAPLLEHELLGFEQAHADTVIVDLSGLTFMDCAGAHLLCDADRRARATGSRLRLAAASPAVLRLLALAGVQKELTLDGPEPTRLRRARA